jgi:hypothetical protein
MATIPTKVAQRLSNGLRRFQPIIAGARARDINEADTVTIVKDVLSELFGFDKYAEVTSEHAIRGTYCDLAIKIEGALHILIEVKAIGIDFKAMHLKQAVDYAANQGVDWVVLTNGAVWQVHRVSFAKPIDQELVAEFDLLGIDPRSEQHLEMLYLLTKEGIQKSALDELYTRRQATSRFLVGALLLTEPILAVIRRELRRISPDVRVECEEIAEILASEVIKREVVESDGACEATRRIQKAAGEKLRVRRPKGAGGGDADASGAGAETPACGESSLDGSATPQQ